MAESKINKTDDLTAAKKLNALEAYVGFSRNDPVITFINDSGTQFTVRFVSTGINFEDNTHGQVVWRISKD